MNNYSYVTSVTSFGFTRNMMHQCEFAKFNQKIISRIGIFICYIKSSFIIVFVAFLLRRSDNLKITNVYIILNNKFQKSYLHYTKHTILSKSLLILTISITVNFFVKKLHE